MVYNLVLDFIIGQVSNLKTIPVPQLQTFFYRWNILATIYRDPLFSDLFLDLYLEALILWKHRERDLFPRTFLGSSSANQTCSLKR